MIIWNNFNSGKNNQGINRKPADSASEEVCRAVYNDNHSNAPNNQRPFTTAANSSTNLLETARRTENLLHRMKYDENFYRPNCDDLTASNAKLTTAVADENIKRAPLQALNRNSNHTANVNHPKSNGIQKEKEVLVAEKSHCLFLEDKENVVGPKSQQMHPSKQKTHLKPSSAFSTFEPPAATRTQQPIAPDIGLLFISKLVAASNMGYLCEIFRSIYSRQFDLCPKVNFMSRQTDINSSMRFKLVDWIIEVVDELKMRRDTLFTCVNVIDRFLSKMAVLRGKLQLVGTTALLICSKFEEIHPPEVKIFSYITENSYNDTEILRMETIILRALKFDICIPTIATFTDFILHCAQFKDDARISNMIDYIGELVLLDHASVFSHHPPAIIAFASVVFTLHALNMHPWPQIIERLADSVGIQFSDLVPCLMEIYKSMSNSEKTKGSVYTKYKSALHASVSTLSLPKTLPVLYPMNEQ